MGIEEGIMEAFPIAMRLRRTVSCGGRLFREEIVGNFDFLSLSAGIDNHRTLPSVHFRRDRRRRRLRHIEGRRHFP